MDLKSPIEKEGLTYRFKKSALQRLFIFSVEDLLFHLPARYEDYTNAVAIKNLKFGEISVVKGKVLDIKNEYTKKRYVLQKATITDGSSNLEVTWFNQSYITRVVHQGDEIGLVGKLTFFGKTRTFQIKEYEVLTESNGIHTTGLVPVYPETRGLSSKWIRNRIYELLNKKKDYIEDYLPKELLKRLNYQTLYDALFSVHFPPTLEASYKARERLAFDELFLTNLAALRRREEWNKKNKGIPLKVDEFEPKVSEFIKKLPFELTDGQLHALKEIKSDLKKEIPMNRLLEGDVGSGKTVVAAIAIFIAYLNGYQATLMAPTEILALQHYSTIRSLLEPYGIRVGIMTGGKKSEISDVMIGTHALIQKNLNFEKLGLVVIDEQQRFGVEQRAILRDKGNNPHFLTMTATPIPRTILLALYKDLDLSILKELPKLRIKVKTWLVPNQKREKGYAWIKNQIEESVYQDQAFIVCPFIEESESINTVKAAKAEFERLNKEDLKGLSIGLLHGKMKPKEKEKVLKDFKDKKYSVLVSTPVVEVGIDIPDATIMVIEAAERFGLSQLHQLRGRVGRGTKQSYCLLFSESESKDSIKRLKHMETANSGFELAELDLKLRGGGDLFGTRQHGFKGLKIANFSDVEMVERARDEAKAIFDKLDKYDLLLAKVESVNQKLINPD